MSAPAWSNQYNPDAEPYEAWPEEKTYGPWYDRKTGFQVTVNRFFHAEWCETYEKAVAMAQGLNDRHHRIARLSMSQGFQPVLI